MSHYLAGCSLRFGGPPPAVPRGSGGSVLDPDVVNRHQLISNWPSFCKWPSAENIHRTAKIELILCRLHHGCVPYLTPCVVVSYWKRSVDPRGYTVLNIVCCFISRYFNEGIFMLQRKGTNVEYCLYQSHSISTHALGVLSQAAYRVPQQQLPSAEQNLLLSHSEEQSGNA